MTTDTAVLAAANPFEMDLDQTPANHQPLTPLGFIARAALICPERTAAVHGSRRYTWRETYARCRRLAGQLGVAAAGRDLTVHRKHCGTDP